MLGCAITLTAPLVSHEEPLEPLFRAGCVGLCLVVSVQREGSMDSGMAVESSSMLACAEVQLLSGRESLAWSNQLCATPDGCGFVQCH